MNRKEITKEVNQKWFHGAAFAGAVHDPEFQEIAQRFLCGDVTGYGTLTDVQKALRIPQDAQRAGLHWQLMSTSI